MSGSIYALLVMILAICGVAIRLMVLRMHLAERMAHVTSLQETLETLEEDVSFHAIAGKKARDGLVIQELDGKILWANDSYCTIMGRDRDEMIGRNPLSFALPPHLRMTEEEIGAFRFDPNGPENNKLVLRENIRGDGTEFWNQINATMHKTEDGTYYSVLSCRDVTEQVEREKELARMADRLTHAAHHDDLTGAANRSKLNAYGAEVLRNRTMPEIGILQIDLDNFKAVNDTHGHDAGDAVLRHASDATRHVIAENGLLARNGGDEFVAVCIGLKDGTDLRAIAEQIGQEIAKPICFDDKQICCSASIGGVIAGPEDTDFNALLKCCDYALYDVKRKGRGAVEIYDSALRTSHQRQKDDAALLMKAITDGSLAFFFQPVACADTGKITTVETLARWDHPDRGIIKPADFLPMAEELGLSRQVDLLALDAAMALSARLATTGFGDVQVSINVSVGTLSHPDFLDEMSARMTDDPCPANTLMVEVSEPDVFTNDETRTLYADNIAALQAMGAVIMLNTFGGGFAGLMRLIEYDMAGFKVDTNVASDIIDNPVCGKMAALVINAATDLGRQSVLQGIETEAQAERALTMGVTALQGDWISPPRPPQDLLAFLSEWDAMTLEPSAIAPAPSAGYLRANS